MKNMKSGELEKALLEAGEPPTMPHVAIKVLEILSDPDFSTQELARVLRADTGLATRVLKIANSAFYGCPREIASLDRAILMLGSRTVKNLVLAASTKQMHGDRGLVDQLLWDHAVAMAIGCHHLASELKIPHREDALVCGLLQNIGQVVLRKLFPDEFETAVQAAYNSGASFEDAERSVFGYGHAEVGAYMVRTWRLAESIEMVIAHQNDLNTLQQASPDHLSLGAIVDVVRSMALKLGLGERGPNDDIDPASAQGAAILGLDAGRLEALTEDLAAKHAAERDYFE